MNKHMVVINEQQHLKWLQK